MDIKEIVKKHLSEAQVSKKKEIAIVKTLEFLSDKWKVVPKETIKTVYDWFESKKDSFNLQKPQPQISVFLSHFDGRGGNEKFDPNKLKEITSYSLKQIVFLWNEYNPRYPIFNIKEEDELPVDKIFYTTLGLSSPMKYMSKFVRGGVEAVDDENKVKKLSDLVSKSKELWEGQKNLIFEDNGFRVYEIPDQITSIAYGWYLEYVRSKYNYDGFQWCTTQPNESNYFSGKRGDRSFYFIIDESKLPQNEDNRFKGGESYIPNFYLCAFQIMAPNSDAKYKLTGIHNPGEIIYSYDKVLALYPKLKTLLDNNKMVYTPWKPTDQVDKGKNIDPVSMINEIEGNQYEFSARPFLEKEEYINRGGVLRKGKSWDNMDKELKSKYCFDKVTEANMYDMFSTSDLFKKLSQSDRTMLNKRIEIILPGKGGIMLIIKNIMQNDFYVDERLSLDKDYISLYKSRTSNKFGIYNLKENNWVNHNGITFDDEYKQISERAYKTKDGKRFFAVIYSRSSQPDNTSFYVLLPVSGNKIDGYFVSAEKWNELKVQLVGETDPEKTNVEFDPEVDNDIKENKQTEKFITCDGCRKKFTQTIYKGKKSKPVCPHCGKLNKKEE
jgi:hypothetical protein